MDTLRACNTGLVFSILLLLPEEVHTRPGVDGTKEATDGIGVWPCQAKFKGQECHTALHGLSPTQATQGNHSIPDNVLRLSWRDESGRENSGRQHEEGASQPEFPIQASKIQANHRII